MLSFFNNKSFALKTILGKTFKAIGFISMVFSYKNQNFAVLNLPDRIKTDLHRFKPNSRDVLINEQLNL